MTRHEQILQALVVDWLQMCLRAHYCAVAVLEEAGTVEKQTPKGPRRRAS